MDQAEDSAGKGVRTPGLVKTQGRLKMKAVGGESDL